jgi:hypothetical protein
LVQLPPVELPAVILAPVAFPVIFWANAGVAIVIGLTVAPATIPKAAITATAIKKSFEFIVLIKIILFIIFPLYKYIDNLVKQILA